MNIFTIFETEFASILQSLQDQGHLPAGLDSGRVVFELPRDVSHGDVACNAAMVLSKQASLKPRDLAERLVPEFEKIDGVKGVEIAGPGFINIRVEPRLWTAEIDAIIEAGTDYGRNRSGGGRPVNVEYVSANPTARFTPRMRGGRSWRRHGRIAGFLRMGRDSRILHQ